VGAAGAWPFRERRRDHSIEIRTVAMPLPLLPCYSKHFPNFLTRIFHERFCIEMHRAVDLRPKQSQIVNKCTTRMERMGDLQTIA
jgi:hypothetical protein